MSTAAEGGSEAGGVGPGDVMMCLPDARVAAIEREAVTLWRPGDAGGLRLRRAAYDLFRAFHLPRLVGEVLPPAGDRQVRVLSVVCLLARKGFLVPPEVGIAPLAGADGVSAAASGGGGGESP